MRPHGYRRRCGSSRCWPPATRPRRSFRATHGSSRRTSGRASPTPAASSATSASSRSPPTGAREGPRRRLCLGRRDAASKPRINRLALERQHPEDALVDPIERLLLDEAVERLEAEGELAKGERALGAQASLAQALEVLGERVLGTVDDAKVLAPAALESGLDQPPPRAHEEVERLDDHPLRTAPGDRLPPARTGLLARRVGHIHDV